MQTFGRISGRARGRLPYGQLFVSTALYPGVHQIEIDQLQAETFWEKML
jgi:hypothetical protein